MTLEKMTLIIVTAGACMVGLFQNCGKISPTSQSSDVASTASVTSQNGSSGFSSSPVMNAQFTLLSVYFSLSAKSSANSAFEYQLDLSQMCVTHILAAGSSEVPYKLSPGEINALNSILVKSRIARATASEVNSRCSASSVYAILKADVADFSLNADCANAVDLYSNDGSLSAVGFKEFLEKLTASADQFFPSLPTTVVTIGVPPPTPAATPVTTTQGLPPPTPAATPVTTTQGLPPPTPAATPVTTTQGLPPPTPAATPVTTTQGLPPPTSRGP